MRKFYHFLIIFVIGCFVLSVTTQAQSAASLEQANPTFRNLYAAGSPFAKLKPEQEIISKRTWNAKHFDLGNGNIQAMIGSGPLHYFENNQWNTISNEVVPNLSATHPQLPYYNPWNFFKTYYGNSGQGIAMDFPGFSVSLWKNARKVWVDATGNELQANSITAQIQPQTQVHKVRYNGVFPDIDAEATQLSYGLETDYYIKNAQALLNAPLQAKYLAFEEEINIPTGWTLQGLHPANGFYDKIQLIDPHGNVQLEYQTPLFEEDNHTPNNTNDHNQTPNMAVGKYQFTQIGNTVTLQVLIPAEWLLSNERNFPIKIDPIITTPNLTAGAPTAPGTILSPSGNGYTRTVPDGSFSPSLRVGFEDNTAVISSNVYDQAASEFDISSLPDDNATSVTTICNVDLYLFQNGNDTPDGGCSSVRGAFEVVFPTPMGNHINTKGDGTIDAEINTGLQATGIVYGWGGAGYNVAYPNTTNNIWHTFPLGQNGKIDIRDKRGTDYTQIGLRNTDKGNHDDPLCQSCFIPCFCGACNDYDWVQFSGNNNASVQPFLSITYANPIPNPATACGDGNNNNAWIMWGYDGADLSLNPANINLSGFATFTSLNINTNNLYNPANSPSPNGGTLAWDGCDVETDNHTLYFKRCGFPCGIYDVNISNIAGDAAFYLNGNFVPPVVSSAPTTIFASQFLDSSDRVEIIYRSTTGNSLLQVDFSRLDSWKAFGGLDGTLCPDPTSCLTLNASINNLSGGQPGLMPCNGGVLGNCPVSVVWEGACLSNSPTSSPSVGICGINSPCDVFLSITSEMGCVSKDTVHIDVEPTPTLTVIPNLTLACSGQVDNIQIFGLPGTEVTWQLSGAVGVSPSPPNPSSPLIIPGSGQLNLPLVFTNTVGSIQNACVTFYCRRNGCEGTPVTQCISVQPQVQAVASASSPICSGTNMVINVLTQPSGTPFTWSRSANANVIGTLSASINDIQGTVINTATTAQTVNFMVMPVSFNGCPAIGDTISIDFYPSPTASISGNTTVCQGGNTTLTALPAGMSYYWSTGGITQSITPSNTGAYSVTVTNGFSCSSTANVNLTVNPNPPAIVNILGGATQVCEGNTIVVDANVGPGFTYSWTGLPCGLPICSVSQPGTYNVAVVVTNPLTGCAATSGTQTLVIHPKPDAFLTATNQIPSPICENPTVDLIAGTTAGGTCPPNTSYIWYASSNVGGASVVAGASSCGLPATITASGVTYLTYNVIVIDDSSPLGCRDTTNAFTVHESPTAMLTPQNDTTTTCQGDTLIYIASGGGTYTWGNLTGVPPYVSGNTAGYITESGTYYVVVTNPNLPTCTDTAYTPVLTFNPSPVAEIAAGDFEICKNEMAILTALPVGMAYQWYDDSGLINGAINQSYMTGAAGNYSVQVINAFNCTDMATQSISVVDTAIVDIVSSQADLNFCQGQDDIILTANSGGNVYQWFMNGSTAPAYVGNPFSINSTNYQAPGVVSVQVTNGAGCISHSTIDIEMITPPNVVVVNAPTNGQFVLCEGDTLTLLGSGANTYSWYQGASLVGFAQNYTLTASAATAGDYYVVGVSEMGGCVGSTQSSPITVSLNPEPYGEFYAIGSTHICKGQSVVLAATNLTGDFVWTLDGNPIPNSNNQSQLTVSTPGIYNLTVTNPCGTYSTTSPITVTQNQNIFASYQFAPTWIHPTEMVSFTNQSTGGTFATWEFGDGFTSTSYNTTHGYAAPGTYSVLLTVSDELGCNDDTTQTLVVVSWGEPFVPNIFTPNGDNTHDEFDIYYADLQGVTTSVYDRWGGLVFQTLTTTKMWDGNNMNGSPCNEGVYFYSIYASKPNGEKVSLKGHLTLIR